MRVVSALAMLLLAGCLSAPGPSGGDEQWHLGGSWTAEFTEADVDAWCDVARAYDNECVVMESFPPQFGMRFASEERCEAARAEILQLDHVDVGECRRIVPSNEPDRPTSSPVSLPSSPAPPDEWRLSGTFLSGYTQADIDDWCAIARAYDNGCALMKSEPPQFDLRFTSGDECEAARARIEALERVASRECRRAEAGPVVEYDVGTFAVTWSSPDRGPHEGEWEVVRAWEQDGLVTINTTTHGIEGGDFRFKLWYTPPAEHGGVLVHKQGGEEPGTFDFTYTESVFWAGRPVTRVESVDPASFVRVEFQDASTGALRGTFHLDFIGRCEQDTFQCNDVDEPRRTVLDGSFGP